ncbi:hypothetical protein KBZ12_10840 [Cyanobium sp. Cruz CV13-4-11]|nr:helix-turn-helix domain-containing protein [Cyanobium sp. Cruz CV11-17]MCP9919966.1 hypothetical protein [Cyanobium sp. Cruz CV13-4-11]
MFHHLGLRAVDRLVLAKELSPRALFVLMSIAARMHPLTGRAWVTTVELAASHGMEPDHMSRHLGPLKRLGLLVRRKEQKPGKLDPWERRFLPDPATRGPHSGRLFMQLHPLLVSVGGRSKRDRALGEFRQAIGDRVLRFEEVIAAIKAEDEAQELAQYIRQETGGQATPAGMGTPAAV